MTAGFVRSLTVEGLISLQNATVALQLFSIACYLMLIPIPDSWVAVMVIGHVTF